jgi:DNA polymerase V
MCRYELFLSYVSLVYTEGSLFYTSLSLRDFSSTLELVKFAQNGLKQIFKNNLYYKRGGVLLTDFVDSSVYQPSLFFNSDPKHKKLMEVIDRLNDKYHRDVIRLASQDERKHKMKQSHLSKHYTTDINEILTVNI